MLLRVDKFFIEELNKNGYDIDFKTLTSIYRKSREHPEYIKRLKHNKFKRLPKGKYYKWSEEELEWIEIPREEYNRLKKEEENK